MSCPWPTHLNMIMLHEHTAQNFIAICLISADRAYFTGGPGAMVT